MKNVIHSAIFLLLLIGFSSCSKSGGNQRIPPVQNPPDTTTTPPTDTTKTPPIDTTAIPPKDTNLVKKIVLVTSSWFYTDKANSWTEAEFSKAGTDYLYDDDVSKTVKIKLVAAAGHENDAATITQKNRTDFGFAYASTYTGAVDKFPNDSLANYVHFEATGYDKSQTGYDEIEFVPVKSIEGNTCVYSVRDLMANEANLITESAFTAALYKYPFKVTKAAQYTSY